jgi:CMP-N,N'-diacetyllegionaminic acid synthase
MIGTASVLAVVAARGGSKGVPRKNVLLLGDKPMIAWTVEAALASTTVDRVIVSSDDREIIDAAVAAGADAPFVRPAELARDDTPGTAPVIHALDSVQEAYDYVVLLQPTSPFRTAEDIDAAVELCAGSDAPSVVSVAPTKSSPHWMYYLRDDCSMTPVVPADKVIGRRQELPPVFELNGAVYVARTAWLRTTESFFGNETLAYVMPEERSYEIDTPSDLLIARAVLAGGEA